MPKIDVNKKRGDPDASVELDKFWLDIPNINNDRNQIVPYDWGVDFGHVATRENSEETDIFLPIGRKPDGGYLTLNLSAGLSLLVGGSMLSGVGMFQRVALLALIKQKTPEDLKIVLIDPINILGDFDDIPHLVIPRAVSAAECSDAIEWIENERESRFDLLEKDGGGLLYQYNKRQVEEEDKKPSIVVIVSELGELLEKCPDYGKLHMTQMTARACEMHVILVTQRPSKEFMPEGLVSNSYTRIAFQMPSEEASELFIEQPGAEELLGQGDGIYYSFGSRECFQGFHVDGDETKTAINKLLNNKSV